MGGAWVYNGAVQKGCLPGDELSPDNGCPNRLPATHATLTAVEKAKPLLPGYGWSRSTRSLGPRAQLGRGQLGRCQSNRQNCGWFMMHLSLRACCTHVPLAMDTVAHVAYVASEGCHQVSLDDTSGVHNSLHRLASSCSLFRVR